jgi:hypothetical protein
LLAIGQHLAPGEKPVSKEAADLYTGALACAASEKSVVRILSAQSQLRRRNSGLHPVKRFAFSYPLGYKRLISTCVSAPHQQKANYDVMKMADKGIQAEQFLPIFQFEVARMNRCSPYLAQYLSPG